jgi:hypothetical protein
MIDFVQESGRAREGGKAVILVVQQRQRQQQQQQRSFSPSQSRVEEEEEEEIKEDSKAMEAFIQAPGCRRVAMSSSMDGVRVNCSELAEMIAPTAVVACDYCDGQASATLAMPGLCRPGELQQEQQGLLSSGQIAWQEDSRLHAIQERVLCRKLTELTQDVCAYCWGILYEVFDGVRDSERSREEEKAEHSIWECPRLGRVGGAGSVDGAGSVGGIEQIDSVRKWVRYKKEIQVCWKCGMLEHLCIQEKERERRQSCVWMYTVLGILCGLREAGRAKRQLRGEEACRETVLGRAGYRESSRESSSESIRRQDQRVQATKDRNSMRITALPAASDACSYDAPLLHAKAYLLVDRAVVHVSVSRCCRRQTAGWI